MVEPGSHDGEEDARVDQVWHTQGDDERCGYLGRNIKNKLELS